MKVRFVLLKFGSDQSTEQTETHHLGKLICNFSIAVLMEYMKERRNGILTFLTVERSKTLTKHPDIVTASTTLARIKV